MRAPLAAGSAFITFLALSPALAEETRARNPTSLTMLTGTCSLLVVAGRSQPCTPVLGQSSFDDGRAGFYFISETPGASIVTFSGPGVPGGAPSTATHLLPVDGIVLSDGFHLAEGACELETRAGNPVGIECAARTEDGAIYLGRFRADGKKTTTYDLNSQP